MRKNTFNRWGHAYANFSKIYIECYRKMLGKDIVSFPRKNTVKVKKRYPKKSNNFHPISAASTAGLCPTIIGLLLRFYNNVQREWQLCRP